MLTANINIEGNVKTITNSSIKLPHSQEVAPSPMSQNSNQGTNENITSLELGGSTILPNLHLSSIPNPEDFEASVIQSTHQASCPRTGNTQNTSMNSKFPEPMDSEELGSASPKSKPKSRTTKRKSGLSS